MSFTVVLDRYLNESVTEYGAILDLELRTTDHKYQNEFNELLQNDNKDALLAKLVDSAKVFLKNMGDNAFEPTANLYINTIDSLTSEMDVDVLGPIESAVKNLGVEQYIASKSNVKPTSVISVLSNVFNFVPETSRLRVFDSSTNC
ncbi:putative cop9 signalosome subunit 7 [Brettanomyces bruxellensis AWRI1499]|nr:putative cop9 signalosome subunit 7 [Brettanomyces bruxellensis AWRI1499]